MAEEICKSGCKGCWPAVRASIKYSGTEGLENGWAEQRKIEFVRDIRLFLDRLQESASHLPEREAARCGKDGVAAEIFLQIDLSKGQVVLDKLFKYCEMDFHLFTGLLEILERHFPDCDLSVPSLQGYDLAREICRFLGVPAIECLYLKADTGERLLMGGSPLRPVSFEGIMEDTARHYQKRGGLEKRRQELAPGTEISMFFQGPEGEEEVLWMAVRAPLSPR